MDPTPSSSQKTAINTMTGWFMCSASSSQHISILHLLCSLDLLIILSPFTHIFSRLCLFPVIVLSLYHSFPCFLICCMCTYLFMSPFTCYLFIDGPLFSLSSLGPCTSSSTCLHWWTPLVTPGPCTIIVVLKDLSLLL